MMMLNTRRRVFEELGMVWVNCVMALTLAKVLATSSAESSVQNDVCALSSLQMR